MLIENENILNSKSGKFILITNVKMHSKRTVFDAYVLYLGHYIDSRIKDRKVNNGEGICILTTINHIQNCLLKTILVKMKVAKNVD